MEDRFRPAKLVLIAVLIGLAVAVVANDIAEGDGPQAVLSAVIFVGIVFALVERWRLIVIPERISLVIWGGIAVVGLIGLIFQLA
ncbi:MAG: hypothetical protein HZY75_04910 [Nocardioidaceae bacterium]|nr:MAG: hypothetical protein HZY75_04910 [Nocardioidaceae bacterium]